MIGKVVGSYRIVEQLGRGGMGVVYIAEHVILGHRAAAKLLHRDVSEDSEVLDRFFNEAKAATKIKHPGIVQIFDFGFHDETGNAYIVMELLEGESVSERISRGPLPAKAAAIIARQVASALARAHGNGIIHRDLKPDNLFLVHDPEVQEGERVKVLDFGIAKLASEHARVTRTGEVFGTPYYMAPEQWRSAADVDRRADIYSLGCILYEMLTGKPPFRGRSPAELVTAHVLEEPKRPSEHVADIPPALERVVMRALAKNPDDRQPNMLELAAELDEITGRRATPMPFLPPTVPPFQPDESLAPQSSVPPAERAIVLSSTTLGRSSGQIVVEPRRSGRSLAIAVGAAALTLVVAVVFVIAGRGGSEGPTESRPIAEPPRVDTTPSPPADAVAPIAVSADAPTPVTGPADATTPVTVPADTATAPPVDAGGPPRTPKRVPPVRTPRSGSATGSGSAKPTFNRGD